MFRNLDLLVCTFQKCLILIIFALLVFSFSCSARINSSPPDGIVSLSVVNVIEDQIRLKIRNGRPTPIFINQQPARDSVPAFIGARITCQQDGKSLDYGLGGDAPLPLLPVEPGVESEFTAIAFKPLPSSLRDCVLTSRYFDNAKAVELVYKSTSPPNQITPEEEVFIKKSTQYLTVKLGGNEE